MSEFKQHTYLTDDRDARLGRRSELVVMHAPNGDYYIGSRVEGDILLVNAVRICTSGGAVSRNPALVKAVRAVFDALGGWGKVTEASPVQPVPDAPVPVEASHLFSFCAEGDHARCAGRSPQAFPGRRRSLCSCDCHTAHREHTDTLS